MLLPTGDVKVTGEARITGELMATGEARITGELMTTGEAEVQSDQTARYGGTVTSQDHALLAVHRASLSLVLF